MTFSDSVKTVFSKYFEFSGRARRSEYWYFILLNVLVTGILNRAGVRAGLFETLSYVWSLAVFFPGLAVTVRRLHDTGRSGWKYLFILIPIVGWIFLIVWFCQDSEPGENQYGPNPKE